MNNRPMTDNKIISTILNDNISIVIMLKQRYCLKIGYKITFICRITEKISIKLRIQNTRLFCLLNRLWNYIDRSINSDLYQWDTRTVWKKNKRLSMTTSFCFFENKCMLYYIHLLVVIVSLLWFIRLTSVIHLSHTCDTPVAHVWDTCRTAVRQQEILYEIEIGLLSCPTFRRQCLIFRHFDFCIRWTCICKSI